MSPADDDCAWFVNDDYSSGLPRPPRPPLNYTNNIFRDTFRTLSDAPDVKLTDGLRRILVAIIDGRRHLLQKWNGFGIDDHVKERWSNTIQKKSVSTLCAHGFIEPTRIDNSGFYEWTVTDAGRAWLVANP